MGTTKAPVEVRVGQVWRDPDDGLDYTVVHAGRMVRLESGEDDDAMICLVDRHLLTDPDEMWKLIKDAREVFDHGASLLTVKAGTGRIIAVSDRTLSALRGQTPGA